MLICIFRVCLHGTLTGIHALSDTVNSVANSENVSSQSCKWDKACSNDIERYTNATMTLA